MSVIRFSKETHSQAIDPTYLKTTEMCMIAVEVTCPDILEDSEEVIYVHKGNGYIHSIISFNPMNADLTTRQEVATKEAVLTCDKKSIKISVPDGGSVFSAGDYINMLLLVSGDEFTKS